MDVILFYNDECHFVLSAVDDIYLNIKKYIWFIRYVTKSAKLI